MPMADVTLLVMGKQANPPQQLFVFYLAEWATILGKRQVDIIEGAEINKGWVSTLWNRNRGRNPSPQMLQKIAEYLNIPFQALLVHPDSKEGRIMRASINIPSDRVDVAVDMLTGLARKRGT